MSDDRAREAGPVRCACWDLAVDVVAHSVLQEVTALREQADTLTQGQLLARLIGCLARLDAVCRPGC